MNELELLRAAQVLKNRAPLGGSRERIRERNDSQPPEKQRKIVAHFFETPKNKNPGNAVFTVFPGFSRSSERGT